MKNQKPKVSLIIPVRNGRPFVREAILSCLNDTEIIPEIVVVDDGSEDGSFSEVSDLPIKWLRRERSMGIANALNYGLENTSGLAIGFLDQDDRLVPHSIDHRWNALNEKEYVRGVLGLNDAVILENGRVESNLTNSIRNLSAHWSGRLYSKSLIEGHSLPFSPLGGSLFWRDVFTCLSGFRWEFQVATDLDFLIRASKEFWIERIPVFTHFYRLHSNNHSVLWQNEKLNLRKRTKAELFLLRNGVV